MQIAAEQAVQQVKATRPPITASSVLSAIDSGKNPVSVMKELYPDAEFHLQGFLVSLTVGGQTFHGSGRRKRQAEMQAARRALSQMCGVALGNLLIRLPLTTTTHTTVLQTFFRDHPGEPVSEENFWTLWCKGRLTEADTPTIRLGATPPDTPKVPLPMGTPTFPCNTCSMVPPALAFQTAS